ncbi:hypothetical protein C5C18_01685 [Rathayibacter tritici]|uniref:Peptidase S1 domain-containing protein n=1 Tax=Rathayibacter tritici TaxID=33888 RepID=A0A160KWU6_9MICO|nr:hypothetical protein [Rathayibacter tritici]AND17928.1 hypothetical protein A6122_2819 [Rathayibacter tritici]PPF28586.1 hypothetical protein C5C06_07710 [Rathayibacter tritici]PPF69850.1 hypothetical protein C5C21_02565 [Rathayibacter tritici]PPG09117.1 hypothetical protein C5C18_01685 [Rathayibacter tritici]PPI18010.1 hypothetical protein C5D07_03930 [Rathayibacter tritici]
MSILMMVAALVGSATPASAEDQVRARFPIVAGTALTLPGGSECTVGAVLSRVGPGSLVSPYVAATRYVLLAKHCSSGIGASIGLNHQNVGSVVWMSATNDVELAVIPPYTSPAPRACFGSIQSCFAGSAVEPRAAGKVIMSTRGGERAVPMRPPGSPAPGERFCTSGVDTGVNCNWVSEANRPVNWGHDEGLMARSTNAQGLEQGDSGGPVISEDGRLYGIIQRAGLGEYVNLMQYMPIEQVLTQIGSQYALAPAR